MTRAAFRHLRERANSPHFDAPRVSMFWATTTHPRLVGRLKPRLTPFLHAPVTKRGQKR